MSFTKSVVLLLSAFSCVQALATPPAIRNAHHHRAVAARVAQPTAGLDSFVPLVVPKKRDLRRRSLARRCKARPAPTSNSTSIALSTSETASSTSEATSSSSVAVPVNVGSAPSHKSDTPTPTPVDSPTPSPTPTPSPSPSPTPSPTPTEQTTEQPTPTPSPSSSGSSSSGSGGPAGFLSGTQNGQGTFYATGLGACGITNQDTDYIAAVSHLLFDSYPGYDGVNPNSNPVCGQKITASYQGKSVTITVTDRCEGCAMTDLDFSPSAFDTLADPSLGRIDITWQWS